MLERNFHCPYGEIDIIAEKDGCLVFVEVKARYEDSLFSAKSAVTKTKQQKLIKTASAYLSAHNNTLQPRFDVAEVYFTKERKVFINYIENAFEDWSNHL